MRPENEHILAVLKDLMQHLGFSYGDLEREIGLSRSYFSRLFSGGIDLRYRHIAEIARGLGLGIEDVVRFAYPRLPSCWVVPWSRPPRHCLLWRIWNRWRPGRCAGCSASSPSPATARPAASDADHAPALHFV
jgi:Cro/C1-type HTH DNA-binding domain